MDSKTIMKTLRKCELFSSLTEEELSLIARLGVAREYNAGEMIYEQGENGINLFVLTTGQVSLTRSVHLGNSRNACTPVYVVRETLQRRLIGGWCALVGEPHVQMCSARCDKPSEVVSIDGSEFRAILVKNSDIRIKILEKLILILRDRLESIYAAMETI